MKQSVFLSAYKNQDEKIISISLLLILLSSLVLQNGFTAHKMLLLPIAILLLVTYIFSKGITKIRVGYLPLLVFVFVAIYSTVFISSDKLFSFWKIVEFLSLLLLAIVCGDYQGRYAENIFDDFSCNLILKFIKVIVVFSAIVTILLPNQNLLTSGYAIPRAILPALLNVNTIIQINANSLGCMAAILLFDSVYRSMMFSPNRKLTFGKIAYWFCVAFVLLFAQSRTAIVALTIAFLICFSLGATKRKKMLLFMLFVAIIIACNAELIFEYILRGRTSEDLANLSGRADYWPIVMDKVNNGRPDQFLFGLGFGTAVKQQYGIYQFATLHSDFFDSLANAGWVGAASYVVYIAYNLFRSFKQTLISVLAGRAEKIYSSVYKLGIIIIIAVRSFTGTTVMSMSVFALLFIVILGNIGCNIKKKE